MQIAIVFADFLWRVGVGYKIGNDANIVPYKSFAAFVTIGKIPPRRNEGIPPCSYFYCSAHTSQPAPSPKIPNFSFLISNFSSHPLPHRRSHQLLPLTS